VYLVVIDAHLHLWNTQRLHYAWLQRPENSAINRTFGFEDFRSRAAATGVDRAVLVQADDTAGDTEAMFEVASAHAEIAGVVAWVPLDRPDEAATQLDRLEARPGFAGIRTLIHDQPDADWLLRPSVGAGLALLEQRGIPFDVISVLPRHLSHVPVLSERYPSLRMVLDHLSHPPLGGADPVGPGSWTDVAHWGELITAAARNPLVYAKISGLYPPDPLGPWTAEDIRGVVEFAFELFGPDRLMFGSDWPVAELGGGYVKMWSELSKLFDQLSPPERAAVLAGTATRFYALGTPAEASGRDGR
jgi:L-fuconolactonase